MRLIKVYFLIMLIAVSFMLCGVVLAGTDLDRTVTVTCDPLVTPDFLLCYEGDSLTVINGCATNITVGFNTATPTETVTPGDSIKFPCTGGNDDCYTVTATSKNGSLETSSGCAGTYGDEIPTLSEWGLIIFSLLILSLVTVVVARRRTATSAAGAGGSVTISGPIFVPARFAKALTFTLGAAVVILVTAMAISGSVPLRDIIGTIISAAIIAYIAHLWIVPRNEE